MPGEPSSLNVYETRGYAVVSTAQAEAMSNAVVETWDLDHETAFGLPEVDDRYHIWRVPILDGITHERVGEIALDAASGVVDSKRSTTVTAVSGRLAGIDRTDHPVLPSTKTKTRMSTVVTPTLRNTILQGKSEETLRELPASSVQLMFTSPPYYNARPDYSDFLSYDEYLDGIRSVLHEAHRLLEDGRFAVINSSPVLLRRESRAKSSRRIGVPFDLHRIAIDEGFEFIDDIIWEKPEGAGWATGRGRRFAADRNPLQYKAVPVTEYVMVYRKTSDRLIDWHIRNHPDPNLVERSKIEDGYEKTNIWRITPAHSKHHPAVFPAELAEKVIRYYSFEEDVVLDPFAGIGTVGEAAVKLNRRFVLSELNPEYVDRIRSESIEWLGTEAAEISCINCAEVIPEGVLV